MKIPHIGKFRPVIILVTLILTGCGSTATAIARGQWNTVAGLFQSAVVNRFLENSAGDLLDGILGPLPSPSPMSNDDEGT